MKRFYQLLIATLFIPTVAFCQLPLGSIAPDWTHNDIFGNNHNLYDLLDEGKMVVVEFSATWCGPCWNYMQSGHLENFWDQYGPNGTNQAQIFYIEADQSTDLDDLYGNTPESQGNWVAAIPFPIIDLQVGENTDNEYQIAYYPTLYAVCADHTVWELGQVPAFEWAEFVTSCTLGSEVSALTQADCYGEGSITLETSGGIAPIQYQWSNGDTGPTLDNVGAGTYSVTVTESNDKFIVLEDLVITGQEEPISLESSDVENALCFESNTGSIAIQIEAGTPPYQYDWSNGAQTQNISNIPADTYTVNVTDNHGCTFEHSFVVTEPDPIEVATELTPDYCDQQNGTIALDIEGGVGGYQISASAGSVYNHSVILLPSGTVEVEIEDNNGCIWTETFDVEAIAEPTLYFSPDPTVTCPEPIANVTGYVQEGSGDYEYEWTTADGNIVGDNDNATVQVDQPGTYNLHIFDLFSGCQTNSNVIVESTVVEPVASAGGSEPISCEIQQVALDGSGDPEYIISWTTTNGNIVSGANTYAPVVDAPGTYEMHVYNPVNECTLTDYVVVEDQLDPATADFSYQTSSLTMIGTNQSTGSNIGNYMWTFGDGNSSTEASVVHSYAAEGTYEVCMSVENGCGVSQQCQMVQVVFVGSVINVTENIGHVACNGNATGSIIIEANGGSGNYVYQWIGPGGAMYSSDSLINVPAGTYQLILTDDTGNTFINEYIITEPAAIVVENSTVIDNLCYGQAEGSIQVTLLGGVPPFMYSLNGGLSVPTNNFTGLPGDVYECLVTDANGCSFLAGPYTIAEPAALAHEAAVTSVLCHGDANGAISITVSGGTAPYSYLWEDNGATTYNLQDLIAGTYQCQILDNNGCLATSTVVVTQPDEIAVPQVEVADASNTEENNGSIILHITGGVAPYSVVWNNGATGSELTNLTPGSYTYTIMDANGCTWSPSAPVIVAGIVGTFHPAWESNISIRPNPSNGNVSVVWQDMQYEKGQMTLITLEGKQMLVKEMTSVSGSWDLSNIRLQPGIYAVLMQIDGQTVPFKIVITE